MQLTEHKEGKYHIRNEKEYPFDGGRKAKVRAAGKKKANRQIPRGTGSQANSSKNPLKSNVEMGAEGQRKGPSEAPPPAKDVETLNIEPSNPDKVLVLSEAQELLGEIYSRYSRGIWTQEDADIYEKVVMVMKVAEKRNTATAPLTVEDATEPSLHEEIQWHLHRLLLRRRDEVNCLSENHDIATPAGLENLPKLPQAILVAGHEACSAVDSAMDPDVLQWKDEFEHSVEKFLNGHTWEDDGEDL